MTAGLSHFHYSHAELNAALQAPRVCACGRPAEHRSGRCATCEERHEDFRLDARYETDGAA